MGALPSEALGDAILKSLTVSARPLPLQQCLPVSDPFACLCCHVTSEAHLRLLQELLNFEVTCQLGSVCHDHTPGRNGRHMAPQLCFTEVGQTDNITLWSIILLHVQPDSEL